MNWITFSQFIFAIGTILLIRKVIIKRDVLDAFDLVGAFVTWVGMTFVLVQFIEWKDWIGLGAGIMQWAFWLFVIIFGTRGKLRARKRKRIRKLEDEIVRSYFERAS